MSLHISAINKNRFCQFHGIKFRTFWVLPRFSAELGAFEKAVSENTVKLGWRFLPVPPPGPTSPADSGALSPQHPAPLCSDLFVMWPFALLQVAFSSWPLATSRVISIPALSQRLPHHTQNPLISPSAHTRLARLTTGHSSRVCLHFILRDALPDLTHWVRYPSSVLPGHPPVASGSPWKRSSYFFEFIVQNNRNFPGKL